MKTKLQLNSAPSEPPVLLEIQTPDNLQIRFAAEELVALNVNCEGPSYQNLILDRNGTFRRESGDFTLNF